MWNFETNSDFQEHLDWANALVDNEIAPLDLVLGDPYDKSDRVARELIRPLTSQVRQRGLWAAHLSPDLGGQGFGQLKLALLNEILGRSRWAPSVFGCQAPDSGNAEILAHYGTDAQKVQFLSPLLDGAITSCYAMTEPQAGSDPALFTTTAVRDGSDWVISGEKWFASNARYATFYLVMVVTNRDVGPYNGMSMMIVPAQTPGIEIVRNVGLGGEVPGSGSHGYVRFNQVRVPDDYLLGGEGKAFAVAQTRLSGGRVHHAMRSIGQIRAALDMMCERALSRQTRSGPLSSLGVVQEQIAESWIELEQFRLLVLRTAWLIDKHSDYKAVRKDIAAVKVAMPKVFHDVVRRAMHLHGALGISEEMPFTRMLIDAEVMAIADGPTEVHKLTVAREVLKEHLPSGGMFPSAHLPSSRQDAERRLAVAFEEVVSRL